MKSRTVNKSAEDKVQALAPFSLCTPDQSQREVGVNVGLAFSESYRIGWEELFAAGIMLPRSPS